MVSKRIPQNIRRRINKLNKSKIMNIKDVIDPMGLLAEPTTEEIKAWEQSEFLSENPYTFIGWLTNYRKNKLMEKFNKIIDGK